VTHPGQMLPGRGCSQQGVTGSATFGVAAHEKLVLRPVVVSLAQANRDRYEIVPYELKILGCPVINSEPEFLPAASTRSTRISRRRWGA
jgi:hypothetical protein